MKTKRELQFLTYLDALERGDAEGISAFLALAEADAELEKMMMDYHSEASPEEKPRVITPFKRKRESANRWLQRFGNGLVAAFVMILVGAAGVIIGAGGFEFGSTSDSSNISPTNPANAITCYAEVARESNQVTLLASGDLDRTMTVGVNNPFIITLNSNRSEFSGGYSAIFEGLLVTIARSSVNLVGDCSRVHNLTVYPKDNPDKTCSIAAERLLFPIEQYQLSMFSMGRLAYMERIVLLDEPVDGVYPIQDHLFDGGVRAEYLELSEGCTSFPLIYEQPFEPGMPVVNSDTSLPVTIELTALRVVEQNFEHGTMFYLEEMGEVWVACANPGDEWSEWMAWPSEMPMNFILDARGNPPDGLFEPQAGFVPIWETMTSTESGEPICDLGWATGYMRTHQADYQYEEAAGQRIHRLTSDTGTVYSFYDTEAGEHFWRIGEE
jgi:hypothetical protein